MKILHLFHHSNLTNGVDHTTLTLLTALQRLGIEVRALVPAGGEVTETLDTLRVPYRIALLGCCTGPSKVAELNYLSQAAARAQLIEQWLREEPVDLVHLNTGHLLDGAIAASKSGVPAIWHIHSPFDVDYQRYARVMGPAAYGWLLGELGEHVIGVSHDVRTSLLQWLPSAQVSTLYNGIDVGQIDVRAQQPTTSLREELNLNIAAPLVLGVGRISAQKDFATFVRVAKQVTGRHPHVCFAIAGPPEDHALAEALRGQIEELGLTRRVFLLGARTNVPALIAQCNALLSTAVFEGQGLACLEAMAVRKPVVAMDCVGLRECVQHGHDALLVALGDEAGCAEAVLQVLADHELARTLGENGRESVLAKYSAQTYGNGFLAIAEQVVRGARKDKAAAADFVLGLLKEVREAHERAMRSPQRPSLRTRLKNRILQWAGHFS